jgi:hypothetical protein
LFTTLAGRPISVAAKGLTGRTVGEKVIGRGGKILEELEEQRGGGAWFARHEEIVPN